MSATPREIERMVTALMTTATGIERAKRRGLANVLATLQAIEARGRILPSELSEELGLHQSSITRQIQALAQEGRVKVTPNPADGRSCYIQLTKHGRAELKKLTKIGLQRFSEFVADWEVEEVRTLARLLEKLEVSKAEVSKKSPQPMGRASSTERLPNGKSRA